MCSRRTRSKENNITITVFKKRKWFGVHSCEKSTWTGSWRECIKVWGCCEFFLFHQYSIFSSYGVKWICGLTSFFSPIHRPILCSVTCLLDIRAILSLFLQLNMKRLNHKLMVAFALSILNCQMLNWSMVCFSIL